MSLSISSVVELQKQHQARHSPDHRAFVDLQVHSTASDGTLPPSEVVNAAFDAELAAIAMTDHDTIEGLEEAEAAGQRLNVRVVPGVELSTHFENEELHLLGLHISNRESIRSALAELQRQRLERATRIVGVLNRHGISVNMADVLAEAGAGAVGRPHIARAIVAGGWVDDFREAFDKWLGFGKPAYMPRDRFEIADAISLVHRAGGLAIWAHPGELASKVRVGKLASLGLDGVETLHPSHPPYMAQKIFDLVTDCGLLPSGGSDWHGVGDGPRRLGGQSVPVAWLEAQDAVLATRRASGSPED